MAIAMNQNKKALISIHFAVILFGLAGVIGKAIDLPAVTVTLGRVFFSSVFLFFLLKIRRNNYKLDDKTDYMLMIAAGIILAVHWCTFIQSIQVSTVAIGTITFSTFPLFVTFMEPYFFREKLRLSSIVEAIAMLLGIIIIIPSFKLDNQMTQGILWGMAGSLSYAALSLFNRRLASRYESIVICLYEQATATMVLMPSLLFVQSGFSFSSLAKLIALGIVCTAVAHSLFVYSLKKVKVQTAGIISGMESVYGILLAFLLLGDIPGLREVIGGLIILGVTFYSTHINQRY